MKNIKRLFGLKGSFMWAVKKMEAGKYVTRQSMKVCLIYRLEPYGSRRIEYQISYNGKIDNAKWQMSMILTTNIYATDWEIVRIINNKIEGAGV